MKARDIISLVGAFFLSFGGIIMTQDVPKWAWWTGQAMVILGPILMGSRAAMAGAKPRSPDDETPAEPKQS